MRRRITSPVTKVGKIICPRIETIIPLSLPMDSCRGLRFPGERCNARLDPSEIFNAAEVSAESQVWEVSVMLQKDAQNHDKVAGTHVYCNIY